MPTRLCAEPKCGNPATYRGRCPTHARTTNRDTHRNASHRRIYNSARWKYLRRRVLYEQPICAICDQALAVDVDHIVAIDAGGNPWARANLQALCPPCHGEKTRAEQLGATP